VFQSMRQLWSLELLIFLLDYPGAFEKLTKLTILVQAPVFF
jgi:hypothetical protein